MSGVPTLEIDALAIDLECLPPIQWNSLFEDGSEDSSNESNIREDYKEVYEYTDSDWAFTDQILLCATTKYSINFL